LVVIAVLLIIEYLVVPELAGASKNLTLLSRLQPGWLLAGIALEAAALFAYALLIRTVLLHRELHVFRLFRIVLATTAAGHIIPGGAAGSTGLGFQLLIASGVPGTDAAFALGSMAIGSAIVLNGLLWIALLVSIPLAGVHPIYVVVALLGVLALLAACALVFALTRGEERAVRVVRVLGRRIPKVGADGLERVVRRVGDSISQLGADRALLRRALLWAALNWLLDAASLWAFVAALGHYTEPFELFAAYGIANVAAAIPLTPGGLGVVEATLATLLISFGVPRNVATLGVLGWRLVNFWLPIPFGGLAYISLVVPGRRRADVRRSGAERAGG
jgi:uncharacterized protein (TIRG00374 family)